MRPRGGRVPHGKFGPAPLKSILLTALLAYAGVAAFLWLTQESLIFLPQSSRGLAAPPPGWTLEKVRIRAHDGTPLAGVLLRPPAGPGARLAAVLYFGGNAEEVTDYAPEAERRYGHRAVLLVNYRGYGESGGKPGAAALVDDALAIHEWASARDDLEPGHLCAHGRSLGSGVAVALAAARPLRCVVLTSPFDSLAAVGRTHYPWLPVGLLLRHELDSASIAGRIATPALVVWGEKDTIIPPEHSRRLADAWGGPVERLPVAGHGHNDLDFDPAYAAAIRAFLDRRL